MNNELDISSLGFGFSSVWLVSGFWPVKKLLFLKKSSAVVRKNSGQPKGKVLPRPKVMTKKYIGHVHVHV